MTLRGVITRVFLPRGFAFIQGEDGKDYFLHADEFLGTWSGEKIKEDARVEFLPATDGRRANKLRATRVKVLS